MLTDSVQRCWKILRARTAAWQRPLWRVRFWLVLRHFENRTAGIQEPVARALVRMSGGFCALSSWVKLWVWSAVLFVAFPRWRGSVELQTRWVESSASLHSVNCFYTLILLAYRRLCPKVFLCSCFEWFLMYYSWIFQYDCHANQM